MSEILYTSKAASKDLPVLEACISKVKSSTKSLPFRRTGVVFVHHALHSSLPVLRAKFQLGLEPKNTFVLNKSYSECKDVVEKTKELGVYYQPCSSQLGVGTYAHAFIRDVNFLWNRVLDKLTNNDIDNLIIMDHGGHAMAFVPPELLEKYNVIGIEKTTAGLINTHTEGLPFPIIDVATCAAKKILESPFIAEAIVNKLTPYIPIVSNKLTCGVVGYGAIGKAVAYKLVSMGHKVIAYDSNPKELINTEGMIVTENLSTLLSFSDYIFGCTGYDISESLDIFKICPHEKTLISCSSEDKEFLSLLKYIQKKHTKLIKNPFNDIVYTNDVGVSVRILKGGFPINFDDSGESVPIQDIQLTRALIFTAAFQATCFLKNLTLLEKNNRYMLDPNLQKSVVNEWIKCQPTRRFSNEIMEKFHDENWIISNSGGVYENRYNIFADVN